MPFLQNPINDGQSFNSYVITSGDSVNGFPINGAGAKGDNYVAIPGYNWIAAVPGAGTTQLVLQIPANMASMTHRFMVADYQTANGFRTVLVSGATGTTFNGYIASGVPGTVPSAAVSTVLSGASTVTLSGPMFSASFVLTTGNATGGNWYVQPGI